MTRLCVLIVVILAAPVYSEDSNVMATSDPLTRYCHIKYSFPPVAPNVVTVGCSWSPPAKNQWRLARVRPFISETALRLTPASDWQKRTKLGRVIERNAAGLIRTIVFDPYPLAQSDGKVNVDFRIRLETTDGKLLKEYVERIKADNSDVVYLENRLEQRFTLQGERKSR